MNDPVAEFREGAVTLGVVGLGYVGLPLVVEAAEAGIRVIGFDVKPAVVDRINGGSSHIQDIPSERLAAVMERVEATTDMSRLSECDVVSICVPTPLSKTRDPDISFVLAASDSVSSALREGQLIVLESTTYPGTTREVLLPALETSGLRVGEEFFLCFSPERVDPGNAVWDTKNTPKVIGGITPRCTEAGVAFYQRFIDTMVPVSSTEAAEMTKILENTFRAVNIGLVNETAIIADRLGVDVWEVIEAAATKPFGFMKFTPGPGLGGHCIPIDPHYLSWKMRTLNYRTRFIELASEINSEMPRFVVEKIRDVLNVAEKSVRGSTILLLGIAYKRDIDDVRESPATDVLRLLEEAGATVLYHDPYVPEFREDGIARESVDLTADTLRDVDAVAIITDHTDIDYDWVLENARAVVDTRNAIRSSAGGPPQRWIVKSEDAR